jgi:hypothetical protein
VREEDVASALVSAMPAIGRRGESAEIGLLKVVPAVLAGDQAGVRAALSRYRDPVERTDYYINVIRKHVELGGKPSEGRKPPDPDGTPREGWTGNPCYHAALMPCYLRVLEHFDLPFRKKECGEAVVRYADFSLELLGGKPIDFDKFNTVCQGEWPSRIVPMIPILLHANTIKAEEKYARGAKVLFDDLMRLVERNPHGYFPVWSFRPGADKYDTVYNPVSYERGIVAFWADEQLDVIGREAATRFVAAQARWLVFSGQLLDSLETDNPTAIRAATHGGHTGLRNQIGLYLHDDFAFYRGLVGDLVFWSAAASAGPGQPDISGLGAYRGLEQSNGGSTMLRWALGIHPGSKWNESRVQRRPRDGFHLQAWNRLPRSKPTVKVSAEQAGLKGEASILEATLTTPAFREAAEFDVTWTAERIVVTVTRPATVRLAFATLRPDWPADKVVLQRRRPGAAPEEVRDGVNWGKDAVEWPALPGDYVLVPAGK